MEHHAEAVTILGYGWHSCRFDSAYRRKFSVYSPRTYGLTLPDEVFIAGIGMPLLPNLHIWA